MNINAISKKCGSSARLTKSRFGIEIETEVKGPSNYPAGFLVQAGHDAQGHAVFKAEKLPSWVAKTDGSLRNYGIEYIFQKPLSYQETLDALEEFRVGTEGIPFLEDQPSTSVHVHVNFGDQTPLVLANFISVWTLFEAILVDFSGPTRRSNLFALPTRLAETQVEGFVGMFRALNEGIATGIRFNQQQCKYSALNPGCLVSLNTMEVRSFRGTTDTKDITEWIDILFRMFEFSRTPGLTPGRFFHDYRQKGAELLSDVFGDLAEKLRCDGFIEMMERQETYMYDLVTSVKNWETFGMAFVETKGKPKKATITDNMNFYAELLGLVVPEGQVPVETLGDPIAGVYHDEYTETDEDFYNV